MKFCKRCENIDTEIITNFRDKRGILTPIFDLEGFYTFDNLTIFPLLVRLSFLFLRVFFQIVNHPSFLISLKIRAFSITHQSQPSEIQFTM